MRSSESSTRSPTPTSSLPERCDVVVIGGGIIGCCIAWYLAKAGMDVILCEKGRIAGEQSSRNWGFVRQQGRDPAEMPAIMESMRIWRGLGAEIGEDVGFHQGGVIYFADNDAELAGYETWLDIARQHDLDTRLLSSAEISKLLPTAKGQWLGALHTPSDGRAEPALATPAIARAAQKQGARVLTCCAVRSLDLEGGRVAGVVTETGRIRTQTVVCAGGIWSSLFSGNVGVRLPQLKVMGSVLRTAPAPTVTEGALWCSGFGLRRRQDGGYTISHGSAIDFDLVPDAFRFLKTFIATWKVERKHVGIRLGRRFLDELKTPRQWHPDRVGPFEQTRVMDPAPNRAFLDTALTHLGRWFPELANVPILETWAGLIDVTPDAVPVISPVESIPGYLLATGFSGHGFGIGPGAGKVAAEMVMGKPTCVDITPFRFSRFTDGTQVTASGAV